jgi:hypothetical protein
MHRGSYTLVMTVAVGALAVAIFLVLLWSRQGQFGAPLW